MYRMKIEFLSHYRKRWGLPWRARLIASLPRYARWAARLSLLANATNHGRLMPLLRESVLGLTARRHMPAWRRDIFRGVGSVVEQGPEAVLLVDTFNKIGDALENIIGPGGLDAFIKQAGIIRDTQAEQP